jgi:hypothetical protein
MIRMLIVGYVFAIRSERRLCAEVALTVCCPTSSSLTFAMAGALIRCPRFWSSVVAIPARLALYQKVP